MKNYLSLPLLFISIFSLIHLHAKVKKKVIVEHFTNTRCSICASRNPDFFKNLQSSANKDVFHIAIHPSAPYSSCKFSQEAKTDNDSRTNFYGIYGGTPRIVIQGKVISNNADYGDSKIYDSYKGDSSDFSLRTIQTKFGTDSIVSYVIIKAEEDNSVSKANLFVALFEDTINYSAPNGEKTHFNILRKAYLTGKGKEINLPSLKGDSIVFRFQSTIGSVWNLKHIGTLAMIQDVSNNSVLQVEKGNTESSSFTSIGDVENIKILDLKIFPNPASDKLNIYLEDTELAQLNISDLLGRQIISKQINKMELLSTENLNNGWYFLKIYNSSGSTTKKIIIQK